MTDIARLGIEVDSRQVKTATTDLDRLNQSGGGAATSMRGLGAAMAALATVAVAKQAIDMADAYTKLSAQLSLSSKNANEYSKAMADVKRISSSAQSDISATAQLYSKLNLALAESGKSQAEVARITEVVSLGLKINGAGAQETASAMLQLSQAFGSGVLRGEEFNAMAEASPNLLKALAASMGIPFGQLRELASQGMITSDVLTKAFADPALLNSYREQAKQVQTISGSMTVLTNNMTVFFGKLATDTGLVSALAGTIEALAKSFERLTKLLSGESSFDTERLRQQLSDTGYLIDLNRQLAIAKGAAANPYTDKSEALAEVSRLETLISMQKKMTAEKEKAAETAKPTVIAVVSKEEQKAIERAARERQQWAEFVLAYETDLIIEKYTLEQEQIKELAKLHKETADSIAGSLVNAIQSSNPAQALAKDIEQAFADKVIKVKVSSAVEYAMESTGKAFDSLLVALSVNTAATEKNTAESSSGGDWIMAIVAAIYYGFAIGEQKREAGRRTTLVGGADSLTGATIIDWEQSRGWFDAAEQWSEASAMSSAQINKFRSEIASSEYIYTSAGDAVGYLNTRTNDYKISVNTTGDASEALANTVGRQLLPAIVLFRQEGETLADTASRLTGVFQATNEFISAIGVSQDKAFGGFGLSSTQGRQALIDASGGLQQFTTNAQGFVKNFLTPAQQLAPALDDVGRTFARLGIEGINTNEQFAALVKQQTDLGETDVVAELLSVADSFNSISKAAADANAQIKALLNKDRFATLVDYQRAMSQGSSITAQQIGAATAAASSILAQEAAGTSTLAQNNANAIAMQNEALVPDVGTPTGGHSQWEFLTDWLTRLWELLIDWIDHLWIVFRDWLNGFSRFIGDMYIALREFPDNIFNAIRDAFDHLYVVVRDAIIDGMPGGGGGDYLDPLRLFNAKGNAFSSSGVTPFADGGAFTNSMYSSPTPFMFANGAGFSQGVMGEAGPEAVMPLSRAPNGKLGVSADLSFGALINEIRALRNDLMSGQFAIALNTKQTFKLLDRWDGLGMPEVRTI